MDPPDLLLHAGKLQKTVFLFDETKFEYLFSNMKYIGSLNIQVAQLRSSHNHCFEIFGKQ